LFRLESGGMDGREDLERRVAGRGVRVEERLALLKVLAQADAEKELGARREALLEAVRRAGEKLRGSAG
jgi:hypothetical protein